VLKDVEHAIYVFIYKNWENEQGKKIVSLTEEAERLAKEEKASDQPNYEVFINLISEIDEYHPISTEANKEILDNLKSTLEAYNDTIDPADSDTVLEDIGTELEGIKDTVPTDYKEEVSD